MAQSYSSEADRRYRNDDDNPAPHTVVAAVACGTTPVPFLAVYAVLFIVHGSVHKVIPPDITGSSSGEFWAGVVAAVLFVVCSATLLWAISGARRWPFAIVQALLFAVALYLLVAGDAGGNVVSVLVALATLAALILILLPMSAPHFGAFPTWPRRRTRTDVQHADAMPAGSSAVSDVAPATARVAGRRPRPMAGDPIDPQA